ncbi:hypothetical protein ANCDUO_03570 [Ancylostoma duodenale]|uniref:Uncharacterized protein n=1 Tax=Ancylostoma duodenale TaxID=51022 RepID=A0A0C2H3I9_9BILA|nr:hypothetical protein ANCDUO_03570 [Ancylostoma duodenale]
MVDDVNEDYTHLVETIVKIRDECRAGASKHPTMQHDESPAAPALEKWRHMDLQANQVEYAVLNRLCRQRLAENRANFVRNRLLDAAHNGSLCMPRLGMGSIMANFYSALFRSASGQTTSVLSPGEEVPHFLASELRHAIETMPQGKAPGAVRIVVELLQACGPTLYAALPGRFSRYFAKYEVPVA